MSMTHSVFNRPAATAKRGQVDANFKILLLICGAIIVPSGALLMLLDGWVRIVFEGVILINLAVLGIAYFGSLKPAK